ncbi:VPLPA-CTERM sorting domain-containing protein [Salipiger pacificus]|uniref:VPLPA-CTERM sorting domain-containing protein n=2 Tax=Salipiger mangrovisoli TaxID=2865933 RepID=A0ABR9WYJ2_9RHOB|nr:VPLPA-CTERM sorting domain-containing protein [Salipiger mangrovisoli]
MAFEIAPAFTGSAMIFEVTNPSNHYEAAQVFVSSALNWAEAQFMGTVDNGDGGNSTPTTTVNITGGPWSYLWLIDFSRGLYNTTASVDGFDVDSIKLSPVPLPAGGLLLMGALGAFGFARRRKA